MTSGADFTSAMSAISPVLSRPRVRRDQTAYSPVGTTPDVSGTAATQASSGMYPTASPAAGPADGGMYSSSSAAMPSGFGGGVFDSSLPSGGSLSIGDMQFQQGNVIPLEQQKLQSASQDLGNILGLAGTGLQTEAQKAVAQTNITPAMAKLDFTKTTAFPFLQDLLKQYGIGGSGGGGLSSTLTSNVMQSLNPQREQAELNAADASAAQAAELGRQQGLRNVAGSGWSPSSPIGAAMTAATEAARVRNAEDAKRNIRNDFSQQRVTNLAQALNAQNSTISPIYSLLNSLMS